jgi:hypothetical protein
MPKTPGNFRLIYRNGSKKELYREAFKFGIKLSDEAPENPLRYFRPVPAPVAHECDLRRMVMNEDSMSKIHRRHSRLARAVIAMFVFAVGMLGGAGAAALLMPT